MEVGHFGVESGVEEVLGSLGVGFVVEVPALADCLTSEDEGLSFGKWRGLGSRWFSLYCWICAPGSLWSCCWLVHGLGCKICPVLRSSGMIFGVMEDQELKVNKMERRDKV